MGAALAPVLAAAQVLAYWPEIVFGLCVFGLIVGRRKYGCTR